MSAEAAAKSRLDKWLWHARFFKTRSLATSRVGAGAVRVNGDPVRKPSTSIGPGDVLTFAQGRLVRVIRVEAVAARRGPATDAQALYTDLSPPQDPVHEPENPGFEGKGRPTKKQRRQGDITRRGMLD